MKKLLCAIISLAMLLTCFVSGAAETRADGAAAQAEAATLVWDIDEDGAYTKPYPSEASTLTLSVADGKGAGGSKALRYDAGYTNNWANYVDITPAATDWSEAEYMYVYMSGLKYNTNISLISGGTEYKLKNNTQSIAKVSESSWQSITTGKSWYFFSPGEYTGWIRVAVKDAFVKSNGSGTNGEDMPAAALSSVTAVRLSTGIGMDEGSYPVTAWFDEIRVSGKVTEPVEINQSADEIPAGLTRIWDLDSLPADQELINSSYTSAASLRAIPYNDGRALKWTCLNTSWVDITKVKLTETDISGAGELWFWLDASKWENGSGKLGIGIGDAGGYLWEPGKGSEHNYSSVRAYYYSKNGDLQTIHLSSWGWLSDLPRPYSGWVGIDLPDLAALFDGIEFDVTCVDRLLIKVENQRPSDSLIIDNICIRPDAEHGLTAESDSLRALPRKVTVTMAADPLHEQNFTWHTKGETASNVELVKAGAGAPDFSSPDVIHISGSASGKLFGYNVHQVKASGLEAGTEYFFRVGDAQMGVWSAAGSFRTDDGDDEFTFAVVDDLQTGTKGFDRSLLTLDRIAATVPGADFWLHGGDLVNHPGTPSEILKLLDDGFDSFAGRTQVLTTGNHDWTSGDTVDHYSEYHFYHDRAESSDPASGIYYSFDYGKVHFSVINTNSTPYGGLDDAQLAWLKADLSSDAAKRADFRIVSMHRGCYSPGQAYYNFRNTIGVRDQLVSVMAQYGVDLVLEAHEHCLALTHPIKADGSVETGYDTDTVYSPGFDGEITAISPESPVYLISGTGGTRYGLSLGWDEATQSYVEVATDAAKPIGIVLSQSEIKAEMEKFDRVESPRGTDGRNLATFSVITVKGDTLVTDIYTVDNQGSGECSYYTSFALKKTAEGTEDPVYPGWTTAADRVFETGQKVRSSGKDRYLTALATAELLRKSLAKDSFDDIIIACGTNFPDALAGSYLAAKLGAPILMVGSAGQGEEDALSFVRTNLSAGGSVYILGGTGAVPQSTQDALTAAGITAKRLSGRGRYDTNLAILEEAGADPGTTLLIADGSNYADALSASALGLPLLLVDKAAKKLTESQINWIGEQSFSKVYILGGTGAVPAEFADAIESLTGLDTVRLSGKGRYDTSLAIAKEFFPTADCITLATGDNFPDGLTGGSLAFEMDAPMVLSNTSASNYEKAAAYAREAHTKRFLIFGGTGEKAMPERVADAIMGK